MRMVWMPAFFFLSGCCAYLNGPVQTVAISTMPPGATVTVDGKSMRSPARVDLKRNRDYRVVAEMPGFDPTEETIVHLPDRRVTMGNLLLLGIPELWESGKPCHYRLDPEKVDISMTPEGWSPR